MSQSIEDVIEKTEDIKAKVTDEHFGKLFDFS